VYREMGTINSFQNLLDNIFLPLYEVTVDPDSHPQLHVFLKQVCGDTSMFFLLVMLQCIWSI
jgi:AMP deaminase